MVDENIKDQLVTVPKLARLLAKDPSFVEEIGLANLSYDEIVYGLELIVGFVLAMYNTAKTIFDSYKTLTLDDKFIQLIYSRFVLMTEKFQNEREALNCARECYDEVKRKTDLSQSKWEAMPLYTKFFEVCVRVLIEERKLWEPKIIYLPLSGLIKAGCCEVLAVAFKGVFSYVDWELGNEVKPTQGVRLSLKKELSRDSLLEHFPLQRRRFNKFSLALAVVVGILAGSLTVRHLVMKYAVVQAAAGDYKKAVQLYMKSAIKAFDPNDTNAQNLKREARQKLERCDRRLKEYEGFWVKYENDWWHVLSKGSFFTICVLSGFGATVAGFLTIWLLHTLSQMSKKAKQQKLYGRYDNSNDYTPSPHRYAGTDEQ